MALVINGRNPNDVFPITIHMVRDHGVLIPSRNGDCLEIPVPVVVTFTEPMERVLFHRKRRINPYLHFFEPFWIMAGKEDLAFLANIVKKFEDYSDNGEILYGAYGKRIHEQVPVAIERLKADPYDRRVVLQIRRPEDIHYVGKDMPCNTCAALKIRNGRLNMHLFNRSNDAVWGGPAGGTNHPQFSFLLEYIAGKIGCGIGIYTVTTDSLHAYVNPQWDKLKDGQDSYDPYRALQVKPFHLSSGTQMFDEDLRLAFEGSPNDLEFQTTFFRHVYQPMWRSFLAYKEKDYDRARHWALNVAASDWSLVTYDWLAHFTDEEKDE